MKRKTKPKPEPALPPERVFPAEPGALFPLMRQWTGKRQSKSTVAFAVTLPLFPPERPDRVPERLRDAFLGFLETEAEKPFGEVRFGGMEFFWDGEAYLLKIAFCPFSAREYTPEARLFFAPDGALIRIEPRPFRRTAR